MNSYSLTRDWFDFAFEHVSKVKSQHTALYLFAVEHNNRLGWRKQFKFPSTYAMESSGIGTYKTYIKTFNDLVEFGFIKLISKAKNQYSANVIALVDFTEATTKALTTAPTEAELSALDKAMLNAEPKHSNALVENTEALTEALPKAGYKAPTKAEAVYINIKHNTSNIKGDIVKIVEFYLKDSPPKKRDEFLEELFKIPEIEKRINENNDTEKEKSSAKKEKIRDFETCKRQFLERAETYYWSNEDDVHLAQLIEKLRHSIRQNKSPSSTTESFRFMLDKLPEYWLTKKFTIPNLSKNYNEIINEIFRNHDSNHIKSGDRAEDLTEFAKGFGQ